MVNFVISVYLRMLDFITVICFTQAVDLSLHHPGITSEPTNYQVRWSLSDVFSKIFCIIILSFWSLWLFYHEELGTLIPFTQLILLLTNINTLSALNAFHFLFHIFFRFFIWENYGGNLSTLFEIELNHEITWSGISWFSVGWFCMIIFETCFHLT